MTDRSVFKKWVPSKDDLVWAQELGLDQATLATELHLCRIHLENQAITDPSKAWRSWMLRAREYHRTSQQEIYG